MMFKFLILLLFLFDIWAWGQKPFDPPPHYKLWYQELSLCTGTLTPPFEGMKWETADSLKDVLTGGKVLGTYVVNDTLIILDKDEVDSRATVTHEMLHYIISDPYHISRWWFTCTSR